MDCGLFAIAFAVFLASGKDCQLISTVKFNQNTFCHHLLNCLEKGTLTIFFVNNDLDSSIHFFLSLYMYNMINQ